MNALALSCKDAAVETGLSPDTIRRAAKRGDLPAKRVGRRIVILADDLRHWLQSQPDF